MNNEFIAEKAYGFKFGINKYIWDEIWDPICMLIRMI